MEMSAPVQSLWADLPGALRVESCRQRFVLTSLAAPPRREEPKRRGHSRGDGRARRLQRLVGGRGRRRAPPVQDAHHQGHGDLMSAASRMYGSEVMAKDSTTDDGTGVPTLDYPGRMSALSVLQRHKQQPTDENGNR